MAASRHHLVSPFAMDDEETVVKLKDMSINQNTLPENDDCTKCVPPPPPIKTTTSYSPLLCARRCIVKIITFSGVAFARLETLRNIPLFEEVLTSFPQALKELNRPTVYYPANNSNNLSARFNHPQAVLRVMYSLNINHVVNNSYVSAQMLQEFLWFVHELGLCNYEKCKRKILRHMVLDGIEGHCNKIKFASTKQLYIRNIYNLSDIFKHAQVKRFIMEFINTTLLAKQGATNLAIPQSE
jgi:hypothetical protein